MTEAAQLNPDRYAECITCGIELMTPEDRNQHVEDTMVPVVPWVTRRKSHSYRIVNMTAKEEVEYTVRNEIDTAVEKFCEDMDWKITRGKLTAEQVTEALHGYPDFADGWEQWLEDSS